MVMTASPGKEQKGPESEAYWEAYYQKNPHPFAPTAFALEVAKQLEASGNLIELGCGNGRDAVFFGRQGLDKVLAIDQCKEEMARLNEMYGHEALIFQGTDFTTFEPEDAPRYVYSRWTIHAIDEAAEDRTLDWVARSLIPGGMFFVEARSILDDLYGKGEKVGEHAYFTDHYRRFMDKEVFADKLRSRGLEVLEVVESRGLAVHKDDDPVIIRVIARK